MENIQQGNRLIAEFMGWAYSPNVLNDGMPTYTYTDSGGTTYATEYMFKYHSSWDWLMPVIEKMEKIDGHFTIGTNKIDYQYKGFGGSSRVGFGYTKVRCVWEVVIQFIQWYNSQPKTDNNDK